jgi:hypothetical protein
MLSDMHKYLFRLVSAGMVLAMLAALTATGVVSAQTTSSPICGYVSLALFNPQAGDQVPPGPYLITGMAQDIRATQGNGISSVQIFLGNRTSGGSFLGNAVFSSTSGEPNTMFSLNASMPSNNLGPTMLEVIATSAVDSQEYVIWVPFTLANPALPKNTGGHATTLPPLCGPGVVRAAVSALLASGPVLKVDHPQPGTTLKSGPNSVSGSASDPRASSGSGIDQVQVFLDSRDAGGTWLANATLASDSDMWQANISLPTNNIGVHALYVYARSDVTGRETVVSVPIKVTN